MSEANFEQAQVALGEGIVLAEMQRHEEAVNSFDRALSLCPDHTDILDLLGESLIQCGDRERAKSTLLRSVEISENLLKNSSNSSSDNNGDGNGDELSLDEVNPGKYMYLGQLSHGAEAVQFYRRGVEVLYAKGKALEEVAVNAMADDIESNSNNNNSINSSINDSNVSMDEEDANMNEEHEDPCAALVTVKEQTAAALCSIMEIYISDLCMEPDAEQQCEAAVGQAMTIAGDFSPEPWVAMASLRIIQKRPQDAVQALKSSIEKWGMAAKLKSGKPLDSNNNNNNNNNNNDDDDNNDDNNDDDVELDNGDTDGFPTIDLRFTTAKLLMEVNEPSEAAEVLETILDEEDTVPDIWYLYGSALVGYGEEDSEVIHEAFTKARDLFAASGTEVDQVVIDDIKQQIAAVEAKMQGANGGAGKGKSNNGNRKNKKKK